jgi:hypothetical protein
MTYIGAVEQAPPGFLSAEAVGVLILLTATTIGILLGRAFIPAEIEMPEARMAMGLMGGMVGSIIGSIIAAIQVGSVWYSRRSKAARIRRELEAKFHDFMEIYPKFEARLAPDMEGGYCWDLKAGTIRLGRLSEDDYLIFREIVDCLDRPLLEVRREAGQVTSTRFLRGQRHSDRDWAVRVQILGSQHTGIEYRDYFYLNGRAVTREALEQNVVQVPERSLPERVERTAPRVLSRRTDGMPRLPGVTKEGDGLIM